MAEEEVAAKSAAAMAQDISDANGEFVAFVRSCSPGDWQSQCPGEDWSVGVVAHHIAWGHERAAGWIEAIRRGEAIPGSPEEHDAGNAAMAAQVAGISPEAVLAVADLNLNRLVAVLRSLSGDELERSVVFGPAGGYPLSIGDLGRGHLDRHLASMQRALGR